MLLTVGESTVLDHQAAGGRRPRHRCRPTGVGKSTLINTLRDQVSKVKSSTSGPIPVACQWLSLKPRRPRRPCSGGRISSSDHGGTWGAVDWKESHCPTCGTVRPNPPASSVVEHGELRRVTGKVSAFIERPAVLVVDESQHMLRTGSRPKLLDCLETLKSFASYGTVFVVFGRTYDMTNRARIERTVGQRTALSFPALRTGSWVPRLPCCVKGFQDRLPLLTPPDLLSRADYMFENIAGFGRRSEESPRTLTGSGPAAGKDTINVRSP